MLDPFNFSNILGYLNKFNQHCCLKSIPIFHKDEDTIVTHVTKFKEVLVTWDITDEDTIIQVFVMSLGLGGNEDMDAWYDGLPLEGISSFQHPIEVFCDQWDPRVKKEILKTMNDEQASEESEVLLGDDNEDQKSIIEEPLKCTELIKFPCPTCSFP